MSGLAACGSGRPSSMAPDVAFGAGARRARAGFPPAAIPGCSHAFSGLAGSHAEYIRVPHGDVNCFHVLDGVTDEQALFLSYSVPTGWPAEHRRGRGAPATVRSGGRAEVE